MSLAHVFDGPHAPPFDVATLLDPVTLADNGFATIAPDLARLRIALGISVFATAVSPVIETMHDALLQAEGRHETLAGLSLGIVLAADGRSPVWIKQHGFVKMWPVRRHPRHGRQLQGIYNTSLMAGIAHGRQFGKFAARNLFAFLLARMDAATRRIHGADSQAWKARQWEDYYRACAGTLRREIAGR